MKKTHGHLAAALLVALFSTGGAPIVFAQESGPEFERQNRVADMLRLLGAQPGSLIADVGAGEGAFTIPIARAVAPNGRAIAVDISESALNKLRDRADHENVSNVEVVVGAVDDPRLPAGRLDAVVIHNAYHEMTEHEAMLRTFERRLSLEGASLSWSPCTTVVVG
jgi:ubiquinone/menaquinone biosynthesis C-methylase UbiE